MNGDDFLLICLADDAAAAVRGLPDVRLARLVTALHESRGGFAELVLGLCQIEATVRWLEEVTDRDGAMGEGNR